MPEPIRQSLAEELAERREDRAMVYQNAGGTVFTMASLFAVLLWLTHSQHGGWTFWTAAAAGVLFTLAGHAVTDLAHAAGEAFTDRHRQRITAPGPDGKEHR